MEDIVQELLGGKQLAGGPKYDATGLPTLAPSPVPGISDQATQAISATPLDSGKVLARLRAPTPPGVGNRGTNLQKMLNGIGGIGSNGMMRTPPANKAAAVLDGLMAGVGDSQNARAASAKASDDQLKQRFQMLKDLWGMDRAKANDARSQTNADRNYDLAKERTSIYRDQINKYGQPKGGKTLDSEQKMKLDKALEERLAETQAAKIIAADDEQPILSRKMKAPERAAAEAALKGERARLRQRYGLDPEEAAPGAATTGEATPEGGVVDIPGGLTTTGPSGTPQQGSAQTSAAPSPKISPDQALREAAGVLQRGADPAGVYARLKENGYDPTPLMAEWGSPPGSEQPAQPGAMVGDNPWTFGP